MIINFLIILSSVLLNSVAQLLLKKAMNILGSLSLKLSFFMNLGLNPYFIGGMICYAISILLWLQVLSKISVSIAQPFLSIGFIFTMVFAYFLFDEPITLYKLIGLAFIIAGIIFLSLSSG